MTELKIRRLPFQFDETVPFQWNPSNPEFALVANAIGVIAVAFEKYIVTVVRQVLPELRDPEVAAEAEAFLRQEAQHARAHRLHLDALVARHPGLRSTIDGAIASYDRLLAQESLEFHVAYIADIEATFTPLFTMMLDNRDDLFMSGDARVASLFLWHFVEEIEHRASALAVYHGVVDDPRYRLRVVRRAFGHVLGVYGEIMAGFEEHVPARDRLVGTAGLTPRRMWLREAAGRLPTAGRVRPGRALPGRGSAGRNAAAPRTPTAFASVPLRQLLTTLHRLLRTQLPGHEPAHEPLPAWADTWLEAYDGGADMTRFAGTEQVSAP